jgi:D-serine deaminase-like pyridoxal phosphate-dependent protein
VAAFCRRLRDLADALSGALGDTLGLTGGPRIVTAGFDMGLPVPLRVLGRDTSTAGWAISELNDQHAYLRLDAEAELSPGDLVGLGISHPCTTLDKWRALVVLNDDDLVIDMVHAFF